MQAALKRLSDTYPSVVAHMDDGIMSRLAGLRADKVRESSPSCITESAVQSWVSLCITELQCL